MTIVGALYGCSRVLILSTGAALNPTIALGLELNSAIMDGDVDPL